MLLSFSDGFILHEWFEKQTRHNVMNRQTVINLYITFYVDNNLFYLRKYDFFCMFLLFVGIKESSFFYIRFLYQYHSITVKYYSIQHFDVKVLDYLGYFMITCYCQKFNFWYNFTILHRPFGFTYRESCIVTFHAAFKNMQWFCKEHFTFLASFSCSMHTTTSMKMHPQSILFDGNVLS